MNIDIFLIDKFITMIYKNAISKLKKKTVHTKYHTLLGHTYRLNPKQFPLPNLG